MDQHDLQQKIVTPILERRSSFDTADRYYQGVQGEWFLNKRFYTDFGADRTNTTTLNFMRPVVDNVCNRLEITNVTSKEKGVNDKLEAVRYANNMQLVEKEVHRGVSRLGEYYVMVWPNADKEVIISYHDPRNTMIIFDPEDPRKKLVGVRIWHNPLLGGHEMQLLWPDKIEKYYTPSPELSAGSNWEKTGEVLNPFGEVPLFLFTPHGRVQNVYPTDINIYPPYGIPEHFDGYGIQDAINKLTITHLVTVDYQGAPQRYALANPNADGMETDDFDEGETEREQHGLKNGPGELWYMRGISTVGQFQPADPEVFLKPIDHNVRCLAATTNTPLHYFKETGNIPSGNALRAAEAPLLKKVRDRQMSYTASWKEVYTFAILVETDKRKDLNVLWQSVESIDILDEWDVQAKKANTGVPFKQRMREAGYDEPTIQQMIDWKKEEQVELGGQYARSQKGKATNTDPEVRTNINKDETNVEE